MTIRWNSVLFSMIVLSVTGCTPGIKNGSPTEDREHWTFSPDPAAPGTAGPDVDHHGGAVYFRIGRRDASTPGDERSSISQVFTCGKGHHQFCTLFMTVDFTEAGDGERPRVTIRSGTNVVRTGYFKASSSGWLVPEMFCLSFEGCGGEFEVVFDVTRGNNPGITSTMKITNVHVECADMDQTTHGHTMVNEAGERLPTIPRR